MIFAGYWDVIIKIKLSTPRSGCSVILKKLAVPLQLIPVLAVAFP